MRILVRVLRRMVSPDMELSNSSADVGFLHRKLNDADVYFIANTSNHRVESTASFSSERRYVSTWDPFAGGAYVAVSKPVELNLAPYESRVIVFSDAAIGKSMEVHKSSTRVAADLTHDWKVKFTGLPVSGMCRLSLRGLMIRRRDFIQALRFIRRRFVWGRMS